MSSRGACGRRGFTLAEVLASLLLSYLIAALALGMAARQRTLLRLLGERAERLTALRTARHVLGGEARASAGDAAWSLSEDSLALRSFRGTALPCWAPQGGRELHVLALGWRAPDPGKDSVLVLRATGERALLALTDRRLTLLPCRTAGGRAERWVLSGPVPPDAVAARWFQRGAYYLSQGALRYRRGLEGRQPVTPEVLATPGSGFARSWDGGSVDVVVRTKARPAHAWAFRMEDMPEDMP